MHKSIPKSSQTNRMPSFASHHSQDYFLLKLPSNASATSSYVPRVAGEQARDTELRSEAAWALVTQCLTARGQQKGKAAQACCKNLGAPRETAPQHAGNNPNSPTPQPI